MNNIIVSGPVPSNSVFYIERDLDGIVLNHILNKDYVNLLGGKQTGKTSLIYRVQSMLEAQEYATTYINLQLLDKGKPSQEWYQDLGDAFTEYLNNKDQLSDLPNVIDANSFRGFVYAIAKACVGEKLLVIFMDEIQSVPEDFREALFNTIRAMFNERSAPRPPDGANKIVFVFAGSFDPDQLIASENSPFNVAQHCHFTSHDFTRDQVYDLADRANLLEYGDEIYDLTLGHPYLTNTLLKKVLEGFTVQEALPQILSDDYHLAHLERELSAYGEDVRKRTIEIANGTRKQNFTIVNPLIRKMMVMGLIRKGEEDKTVIRCPIYQDFLSSLVEPEDKQVPDQLLEPPSPLYFISNPDYRSYLESVLLAAESMREKQPYIALVCAGIAVEGILIDELQTNVDAAKLPIAIRQFNKSNSTNQIRNGTQPLDWNLHQLIEIAEAVGVFDNKTSSWTHILRDWRNYVHPGKVSIVLNDSGISEKTQLAISAVYYVIAEIRKRYP